MQHFLLATRALFVALLLLLLPLGACPASGVGERGAGAATDVEKNADANAAKVAITASERERGREWERERERGSSKSVASVANVVAAVGQHHFGPQHSIVCASLLLSSLLAKQRCLYTLHSSHAYLPPSLSLSLTQCTVLPDKIGAGARVAPLPPAPAKAASLLSQLLPTFDR